MKLPTPDELKYRREKVVDITQSELAERAGVSQPLIARIEGGDVDPRLSTLRRIVNALEAAEGDIPRAEDIMHEAVASVQPDETMMAAEEMMEEHGFSQLPVLEDGVPVGSISHSDILSKASAGEPIGEDPVREHMSEAFPSVQPDKELDEIQGLLELYKAVMVTDAGQTVGIITEADVAAQIA